MPFKGNEWKPNAKQAQFLSLPLTIKEGLYGGGAGSGKMLEVSTPIATPNGLIAIKDIHVGDVVFDRNGFETKVIGESEILENRPTYKLTFDNNEEIICDENHEWATLTYLERIRNSKSNFDFNYNRRLTRPTRGIGKRPDLAYRNSQRKYKYREIESPKRRITKEIFNSLLHNERTNHSIKLSSILNCLDSNLLVDPYTLGAWLGDGSKSNATITNHWLDSEIMLRIVRAYNIVPYDHKTWGIHGLIGNLKQIGVYKNKHIPAPYLFAKYLDRIALLQGLMDTDGYCELDGSCEISISDEKLANDIITLLATLGLKPFRTINKATLYGVEHKLRHRIKFVAPFDVFSLKRKLERQKKDNLNIESNNHYIVNAQKIESVPMKCIAIESQCHEYLCGLSLIPTHNSEVLLMYPLVHKWHENPRFKQVFMRRTFPELRAEIVPRSREFYLKFGAKLNKSEMSWTFPREDQYGSGATPDGATIFLAHCENEDDVHKYDSMEINLYTPDELTSYTYWIYSYIGFQRVRTSDMTLPAIIRAAGMPGGIGHTWVKDRFIKAFPKGGKILIGKGGIKRIYIHSTLADNEAIDPNYSQSLDALPEAERLAKKFGNWDSYLGQVFEEFRNRKIESEPVNALHVIEPVDVSDTIDYGIPDWWPRLVAIDWGYAAATCVLHGAISPEHRLIIYREDLYYKEKIEEWGAKLKHILDATNPKIVKLCRSAGQDRGQEHTIHQQVETALGRSVDLTANAAGSRIAGKLLVHEYLRWKPKFSNKAEKAVFNQEFADWLMRNKGDEDYKAYIDTFKNAVPEENIPKLQIFRNCDKLIDTIKACVYDKNDIEDVAEFPGDDPYDTLRYLVDAADRFFDDVDGEASKLQKRANLAMITDMTAFYRNARRLDAEENVPMAVSRFHRGRR